MHPRPMNRIRLLPPALLALCLWLGPGAGWASAQSQQEAPPASPGPHSWHPEALKAIDELRSPYCPALMLEVCPSPGGAALRDTVEMLAESGMKSDSIVSWVLAKYGKEWLVLPPSDGRGALIWAMPFLAVAAGLAVAIVVLRRIRRPPAASAAGPEVSAEESARLEAAIRELEAEEEPLF